MQYYPIMLIFLLLFSLGYEYIIILLFWLRFLFWLTFHLYIAFSFQTFLFLAYVCAGGE